MPVAEQDVRVGGYVAARSFKFSGSSFRPGDQITLAVLHHRRFESLLASGFVRMEQPR